MKKIKIFILIVILSSCSNENTMVTKKQYFIFGTIVEVMIWHSFDRNLNLVLLEIEDSLNSMHKDWHTWEPGRLMDINLTLRSGKSIELSEKELKFLKKTQSLSESSKGYFNPAIGELIHVWGFHTSDYPIKAAPPNDKTIQSYLKNTPKMSDLIFEGNRVSSQNTKIWLDFGGIAKGYAIDQAIQSIKKFGIKDAIINAGGDLRSIGTKGDQKWKVAIRRPKSDEALAVIEVEGDESIFTSGNYERYKEFEGKRYAHIINPFTGYGIHEIQSATVILDDGVSADSAATAMVVAGVENWKEIIDSMNIDQALLIKEDGSCVATAKMLQRLKQSQLKCDVN